jgi:type IV secretion system protein VirB10
MTTNTIDALDGERGIPGVNASQGVKRGQKMAMMTLIVVAVVGIVGGLLVVKKARATAAEQPAKDIQVTRPPAPKTFAYIPDPPPRRPETEANDNLAALPTTVSHASVNDRPPVDNGEAEEEEVGEIDKAGSKLKSRATGKFDSPPARRTFSDDSGGSGALDGRLTASRTPTARAYMMPDRNFLLAKGSSFKCSQRTRIVSTVPGMTACTVTRNVFSDNGNVLLIPRGSRVVGEYRSDVQQGMARIGVLYTQIDTPDGIRIPLNSPGADSLGATGVPGWVDTHFWARFGGAILLSLLDDTAAALASASANRKNGQTFNFGNTADNANDVASKALENSINIPPTLYVNQGDEIVIFVARDLDFSDVYELTSEDE